MPSLHELIAIIINSQDVPVTWGEGEMCVLAKCLCYKVLIFIVSLAPSKAIFFQTCLLELQFLDFMADCFVTSGGIYAPKMTFEHEPVLACFTRLSLAKLKWLSRQRRVWSTSQSRFEIQRVRILCVLCFMPKAARGVNSRRRKKTSKSK